MGWGQSNNNTRDQCGTRHTLSSSQPPPTPPHLVLQPLPPRLLRRLRGRRRLAGGVLGVLGPVRTVQQVAALGALRAVREGSGEGTNIQGGRGT